MNSTRRNWFSTIAAAFGGVLAVRGEAAPASLKRFAAKVSTLPVPYKASTCNDVPGIIGRRVLEFGMVLVVPPPEVGDLLTFECAAEKTFWRVTAVHQGVDQDWRRITCEQAPGMFITGKYIGNRWSPDFPSDPRAAEIERLLS